MERFWPHARGLRQAYDVTYDCRSYDIFSDIHNNHKACRGRVLRCCFMRQKLYRVNQPFNKCTRVEGSIFCFFGTEETLHC